MCSKLKLSQKQSPRNDRSLSVLTSLCTGHAAALSATAGARGAVGGVSAMETSHSSSPSWSTSHEDSYSEREKVL